MPKLETGTRHSETTFSAAADPGRYPTPEELTVHSEIAFSAAADPGRYPTPEELTAPEPVISITTSTVEAMDFSAELRPAVERGDVEAVQSFLTAGYVDVNIVGADGYTALHIAVLRDQVAMVQALLDLGADVNRVAADGYTALHIAVLRDNVAMVQALLELGADVNIIAADGSNALHLAEECERCDNVKIVELLVRAGINAHLARTADGYRPLHLVAKHFFSVVHVRNWIQLVKPSLLDFTAKTVDGYTAQEIAISKHLRTQARSQRIAMLLAREEAKLQQADSLSEEAPPTKRLCHRP